MQQLPNYADQRQLGWCAYCGGDTSTRDHVPSKVFLDEPYPENLAWVPCCRQCNNSLSVDEEYLACLVECVTVGSASAANLNRGRIRRILERSPALAARLAQAERQTLFGDTEFIIERERVERVLLKLARGHALFELNERQDDDPLHFAYVPLHLIPTGACDDFEAAPRLAPWPEVGSRAMQRIALSFADPSQGGWVTVQPNRYRYLATLDDGILVRFVIGEYLACEVVWSY
jgi:hypothetical protein